MAVVVALMALVVVSFVAMATAESASVRARWPWLRRATRVLWLLVLVTGWLAVAWVVVALPGGADAAWAWVSGQPLWMRVAMWVFLLPWTGSIWIAQSSWAPWVQVGAIGALAIVTVALAISQLADRGART